MSHSLSLTTIEAACLAAVRAGNRQISPIVMATGLTAHRVRRALIVLAEHNLIVAARARSWDLTPLGQEATVTIKATGRRHARPDTSGWTPGPSARRLLELLDQPKSGSELARLMELTRQRIHQIVLKLYAFGLVRVADPDSPVFLVARKDDPSLLLRPDHERVLCAFPDAAGTTVRRIAVAAHIPVRDAAERIDFLREVGLVEQAGNAIHPDLYRLTSAGVAHHQRSATDRRADLPSLPFRSDRVLTVLSHLDRHGPIRTRDVGYALDIAQPSMNALMQNLKRKGVVRTQSDERNAPYILTPVGVDMLAAMRRQSGAAAAAA